MTQAKQNLPTTLTELISWLKTETQEHLDEETLAKVRQTVEKIPLQDNHPAIDQLTSESANIIATLTTFYRDKDTIISALLYPFFSHSSQSQSLISDELGETVWKLLVGLQRMATIDLMISDHVDDKLQQKHADNLRKMLLAIVGDIRIVLLKLAERLHYLQQLRHAEVTDQQQVARQIIQIYAPLANRLGIGQLKWQLEDAAFRYLNPSKYSEISKALNMRRVDRERYIKYVQQELEQLTQQQQIHQTKISGRAKHIYSIYHKIQRKNVDFKQIFDTSAFRVLVPTIKDCYTMLSTVHSKWQHIPQEFDDYIAKPKKNGYRSIHTAVIGPEQHYIEIQIRTFKMHEEAELGVAAHWKYKEGKTKQTDYADKINLLREVIDWQKEMSQDSESKNIIYNKIFEDRIYVFTPLGEIIDLPNNATPLDFAYHIHSEIGHRCRGAKINEKMAPLTQLLKTGDTVDIITHKQGQPSRDWLNKSRGYINTHTARNKIRQWFRRENYQQHLEHGQQAWDKLARREHLDKQSLQHAAQLFDFKSGNDLLANIGSGDLSLITVFNRIKQTQITTPDDTKQPTLSKTKHRHTASIAGTGNFLTQLARCCQPIPGDDILGYITKGRGISIHKIQCPNIQQSVKIRPQRIIKVHWGEDEKQQYPTDLIIDADNRNGLIRDISTLIVNEKIPLLGITSQVNKLTQRSQIQISIEINNTKPLQSIINKLQAVPSIISVTRK